MRRLSPYPFKEKNEILDFARIPDGRYEMNFRPPSAYPTGDIRRLLLRLWLVALSGALYVFALRYFLAPFLDSLTMASIAMGIATILAVINLTTDWCPPSIATLAPDRGVCLAILVLLPLATWLLAVIFSRLDVLLASSVLLAMVAIPVLLTTADLITTNFVHWMSANPRIDNQTMRRWRSEWRQRFRGFPRDSSNRERSPQQSAALQRLFALRDHYVLGFLLVVFAVTGPAIFALFCRTLGYAIPLGPTILIGQLTSLSVAALYRASQAEETLIRFLHALEHWLTYGQDRFLPPWVFRSPSGLQTTRNGLTALAVFLLAIAIVPIGFVEAPPVTTGNTPDGVLSMLALQWTPLYQESLRPTLAALQNGRFTPLVLLVASPVLATTIPVLYFLLVTYIVATPALAAHHYALDAPDAIEQHSDWSVFDGYTYRLANSHHADERSAMLLGFHPDTEYPVLLEVELLREHMHVLGATGSSKTAIGLSSLTTQAIRRGDGAVIILDCKGDPAYFNTMMIESEKSNRTFKWFTNRLHRSTYVFNPFNQRHLRGLTLPEYVGLFMMSLNLHHGEDYGRAWFSAASRRLFLRALQSLRAKDQSASFDSFRQLNEALERFSSDDQEYRAALHLTFIVQSLAQFRQLNLSPRADQDSPALRHAIHMPDVIRDRQVVYFSLVGATDIASVAQIAKLVVYSALSAAMAHRDTYGERPKVYLICDEAHTIIGQNIQNVLAQAREHGLACVLAHQTMSQLNPPGGVDLRELVKNCTCVKQIFTARDKESIEFVSDLSGRVGYYSPSWQQSPTDVASGQVSLDNATAQLGCVPLVNIRQEIGPRLTPEDIADINRDPNLSTIAIERNAGCSAFLGAFPVHTDWLIGKTEYDRRHLEIPWPAKTDETIELEPFWPAPNEQTIVPTHHPALSGPGDSPAPPKKLEEMKRKIDMQ